MRRWGAPRVAAALIVALVAAPLGSGADEGKRPGKTPWARQSDARPPAVADLARVMRGGLTLGELLGMRNHILASPSLEGGAGFTSASSLFGAGGGSEGDVDDPPYLVPVPSGDLDGDGKDDVLAVDVDYFGYYGFSANGLRALSGLDGSELWSVDLGFDDAFLSHDVDGDGDIEIVVLHSEFRWSDGVSLLAQEVTVLDGATGTPAWSWSVTGSIVLAEAYGVIRVGNVGTWYSAEVMAARGLVASVAPQPDANGDGTSDLFVGTFDLAGVGAMYVGASASRFVARALDGGSGEQIGQANGITAFGDIPWGAPAPDLSGDGRGDALMMSGSLGIPQLRAVGFDGETIWRATAGPGIPSVPGDMTGDGKPDVAVLSVWDGYYFEPETIGIAVIDGADGTLLWEADTYETPYLTITGAIEGAGIDVLVAGWIYDEEDDTDRFVIQALSGATGDALWNRDVVPPSDDAYVLFCFCPEDLNGDGTHETLFAIEQYEPEYSLTVHAVNGSTGTDLWSAGVTDWWGLPVPIDGDADGDGGGDLRTEDYAYDDTTDQETLTINISRGADFTPLWSAAETVTGWLWVNAVFGSDVAGSPADELILGLEIYDEDLGYYTTPISAHGPSGRIWTT